TILLRSDLAALLRDWLADRPAGQRLWPGGWWRHGAKMVRKDLTAAGIPYADADGRVFDFHSLPHQFVSSLAAARVHPKVAQALARHSTITLTMNRYTRLGLHDEAAALDKLPQLPAGPRTGAEALRATGTDGSLPAREVAGLPPAYRPAYRTDEAGCG